MFADVSYLSRNHQKRPQTLHMGTVSFLPNYTLLDFGGELSLLKAPEKLQIDPSITCANRLNQLNHTEPQISES